MKILNIFNHYLEPGGEAIAVDAICSSLSKIFEIERCDFSSVDWIGTEAPAQWKQALWMIRNPESVKKLRQTQERFRSDVWLVHNVFPVGSGAVYSESRRQGIPLIQYIHNFRPFSVSGYLWAGDRVAPGGLSKNFWQEIRTGAWRNSRMQTIWMAFVLSLGHIDGWWRVPKTWIAISEFMRQKFILAGVPADSIFTLRHFWRAQQTNSSGKQDHFLFLGRLTEAKGINVLLDAWERLESTLGDRAPKLIIGGDGPSRSSVVSRVERMKSVIFYGPLDAAAKREALNNAIAVIAPSLSWEAFGLVVYEAYDHYLPALVARSGGLPELVVDSKTGFIHEPGNTAQLIEQVLALHWQPALAAGMGRAGRLWLEENANEADWQRNFSAILKRVVA